MLRITQQLSALSLAGGFSYRVRWIPSEHNTADGPSRGQVRAGSFQPFPWGTTEAEGACEIVEQPTAAEELPNETRCEDLREEEGQTGHSSDEERKREVETTTSSKGREAPTATGDRCGAPAQTGRMTILEERSVSAEVQHQYHKYFAMFENFCQTSGISWPQETR